MAWKSVNIKYIEPSECPYEDETSRWNWLWHQIKYEQSTFGVVSGAKAADVVGLITRLIGLRLIYPDGTINLLARKYLQAAIMAKLSSPKKPGRPRGTSNSDSSPDSSSDKKE